MPKQRKGLPGIAFDGVVESAGTKPDNQETRKPATSKTKEPVSQKTVEPVSRLAKKQATQKTNEPENQGTNETVQVCVWVDPAIAARINIVREELGMQLPKRPTRSALVEAALRLAFDDVDGLAGAIADDG